MYYRYRDLRLRGITYSRQHLRRLIKAGLFPAPVHLGLGSGAIAWLGEDLDAYDARIRAERDARQSGRRAAAPNAGADNARPAS